jgi:flagellar L-ring protein precursor FlgH
MRSFTIPILLAVLISDADAESIFERASRGGRVGNPIEDDRAARVGDLLTIIVRESHKLDYDESIDRERKGNLDVALTNYDIKPETFNKLPAIKGASTRTFEGEATYEKEGTFQARITVRVVDVLPNRVLVVAGCRTVALDGERKVLRMAGLVRPADITGSNTVLSEQVADARISFKGHGTLSRATDPGVLDGFWHMLGSLLPF